MFSLVKFAYIACNQEQRTWYNNISTKTVRIQVSKCCRILMQRARGTGGENTVCQEAARQGHVDCLQAACRFGYQVDEFAFMEALTHGSVECIEFMLCNGFQTENMTLTYSRAIVNGHLECARTLLRHGVPWDGHEVINAVVNKHVDCLRFLLENGCTQFSPSMDMAVAHSDVACVTLLRNYGMPWVETIPSIAYSVGNNDLLRYAIENGCPNPCRYGVRRSARILERTRFRRFKRRRG